MRVHREDNVLVIAGREKGKSGKISRVLRKEDRVVIEGVNLVKRHMKARPGIAQAGIVSKEAPIHISNVMLLCPQCNHPTRVGHRYVGEVGAQRKERYCKQCEEAIE